MKTTIVTSNEDLEALLNRILSRITVLEEKTRILDAEVASIVEIVFVSRGELDS